MATKQTVMTAEKGYPSIKQGPSTVGYVNSSLIPSYLVRGDISPKNNSLL